MSSDTAATTTAASLAAAAAYGGASGGTVSAAPTTNKESVSDYEKLFATVRANPLDFSTWTKLLKACDTQKYEAVATAFDAFLSAYPFCYGYWKKFADHTQRHATANMLGPNPVIAIYERGVVAVRYSVDMWGHYCNFMMSLPDENTTTEAVRAVLQRAINVVGSMPSANSNKTNQLWNSFLRFELETTKDMRQVATVYHQLLQSTFKGVGAYLTRYEEWAKSPAANLDSPNGAVSDVELGKLREGVELIENFEEISRQAQIVHCITARHKRALSEESARSAYEAPLGYYFHVKPVSDTEQKAWKVYLAFEQQREKTATSENAAAAAERTTRLFERCVIRNANYPEFWRMYAEYKASRGASVEEVIAVHRRCTDIHLTKHPTPRITLADYLELNGRVQEARAEYAIVTSMYPGMIQGALANSNFERRHGNIDAAEALLAGALAANLTDKSNTSGTDASAFLAVQLANFQLHIRKNLPAARHTFESHLNAHVASGDYVAAYIAFEISHGGIPCAAGRGVDAVFARLLAPGSGVPSDLCAKLWRRRVEIAEDFGEGYDIRALDALRNSRDTASAAANNGPTKRSSDGDGGAAKKSRVEGQQSQAAGATQNAAYTQQAAYGQQAAQDPAIAAQWAAYYAAYGQQQQQQPNGAATASTTAYSQQPYTSY